VIPGLVLRVTVALDVGQRPVEEDEAVGAKMVPDAVEAIVMLVGKPSGQCLLRAGEHVDHEFPDLEDGIVHVGLAVHADRDEGRAKRDRGQAVRGHADGTATGGDYCQDRHPGGEPSEQLAELGGIDLGRAHRIIRAMKTGFRTSRAGTKPPANPMTVCAISS